MIEIDGSIGGGQILRTALSLSALMGKPFKIINIRGKREKSGLQPQHLICVNSLIEICDAKVKGNELQSHELEFTPGKIKSGNYSFDIGTAGSTTLVLQTLLLPLIFDTKKKSTIEIIGGTANPLAPPAIEIKEVFLHWLKNIGINIKLEIEKEGFFPKGGGRIKIEIEPCNKLKEVSIVNNEPQLNIVATASKELQEREICSRMIKGFKNNFLDIAKTNTKINYVNTLSPGCYIHANYKNIGMSVLGDKRKKAEDVGKECAEKLKEEIESMAEIDSYTTDQLLIYLAMKGSDRKSTRLNSSHMSI